MKYFGNAIKFSIAHPGLTLPLFACTVLYYITGYTDLIDQIQNIITKFLENHEDILKSSVILNFATGACLALMFQLLTMPLLYGLIYKGLTANSVSLKDSPQAFRDNVVRYVKYCAGYFLISVPLIVFFVLLKWLAIKMGSPETGTNIMQLTVSWLADVLALYAGILLSLWFAAMVVDNLGVFAGMKKSLYLTSSFFGTLLIVFIILIIAQMGSNSIFKYFGLFNINYLFTSILTGLIAVIKDFVLVTFFLMLYRGEAVRK